MATMTLKPFAFMANPSAALTAVHNHNMLYQPTRAFNDLQTAFFSGTLFPKVNTLFSSRESALKEMTEHLLAKGTEQENQNNQPMLCASESKTVDPHMLAAAEDPMKVADNSAVGLEENELVKNARLTDRILGVFLRAVHTNIKNDQFLSEFSSKLAALGGKTNDRSPIVMALAVAEETSEPRPKAKALMVIADLVAASGEKERSIILLNRVLSIIQRIQDQYYRAQALIEIMPRIADLEEEKEAVALIERSLSIVEKVSNSDHQSSALIVMASHIAALKDKEAAVTLLERARDIAAKIKDPYFKAIALAAIAVHIAALGDKQAAMVLIKRASDAAEEVSYPHYKAIGMAQIAVQVAALGDKQAAMALIKKACDIAAAEISDSYYEAEALSHIASHAVALGEKMHDASLATKALEITRGISDPYDKAKALADKASRIAAWGERADDLSLIESALSIARREIEAPYQKAKALAAIASHIAALGKKTDNSSLTEKAIEIAEEEIFENSFKAKALADIAIHVAAMGDKEAALALIKKADDAATKVSGPDYRDRTLLYMTSHIAAQGEEAKDVDLIEEAIAIEKEILGPAIKVEAIADIASHLAALGEKEEAIALLESAIPFAEEIPKADLKEKELAEIYSALMLLGAEDLNKKTIHESLIRTFPSISRDLVDILAKPENILLLAFSYQFIGLIRREEFEAKYQIMNDPMLALVLCLFSLKSGEDKKVSDKDMLTMLNLLSPEQCRKFAEKLFEFPELARSVTSRLARLESIALQYEGDSLATFPDFTRVLLRRPAVPVRPSAAVALKEDQETLEDKNLAEIMEESGTSELKFDQAFGRTLLFRGKNDEYLALKMLREKESVDKHLREEAMLRHAGRQRETGKLESDYPVPIGVFNVSGIDPEHDQGIALAYRSKSRSYFTYLNDENLSQAKFEGASFRVLNDLFRLARDDLIHIALIELFHNLNPADRTDLGRYLWMVDFMIRHRFGTGRLHGWTKGVRFPNLRESGLADLADTSSLEDLIRPDNPDSAHLLDLERFEEKAPNYYRANYFGEYLLSWALIVGSRYLKLGLLDWQDSQKVASLADLLHRGFSHAFSVYTKMPKKEAHIFLGSIVDWERMARQMSYFMTDAYVDDFKKGSLPKEIFDEGVEVKIPDKLEGFRGWSSDGENPDLGPTNGPFPLQELVRALYLSAGFMVALHQRR